MNSEALAWAIGIGMPVLVAAVGFLANWLHKVDNAVKEVSRDVSDVRAHTAETYVRGHEIAEVKTAVNDLRTALTTKVDDLLKSVHELIGKQSR